MKKIKLFLLAIKILKKSKVFNNYSIYRLMLDYILKYKKLPQAKITNPEMEETFNN
tara:strand:- start:239 stop:406 length:168 start_codon:yes stop_codon:yes gene_type:complete